MGPHSFNTGYDPSSGDDEADVENIIYIIAGVIIFIITAVLLLMCVLCCGLVQDFREQRRICQSKEGVYKAIVNK